MSDDAQASTNQYIVVVRAGSRLRFEPNEELQINLNIDGHNVVVKFRTIYTDEGFESLVARELWIDARGVASSLNFAVTAFTNAVMFFTNIISFCANGYTGDCRFHIAYDNTSGKREREFFEQFVEGERGMPRPSRRIKPSTVIAVIEKLAAHKHTERLRRAIIQYVLALRYWGKGDEILATAHLYMGMEALVYAVRQNELERLKFNTTKELADYFKIPLKELDSRIRQDILFQKDEECQKHARDASDGIEHGFLNFDEIRPLALTARDKTATYLRQAIVSLLQLPAEIEQDLITHPYDKPIGTEGYIRYLRGYLLSDHDQLAEDGKEYPTLDWAFRVISFQRTDDNKFVLSFSQDITPRIGVGVAFRPQSVEIYGPEGVISNPPSIPQKLEPKIIPKDAKHTNMTVEELVLLVGEALQDNRLEELKIRTKEGDILVINPESKQNKT